MISSSNSNTRYRHSLEVNRQARLAADIARAQIEISSGKRILAPSDAPVDAARVSRITRSQADGATWARNVETASALASRADTALGGVATALDRASELMLSASTGTMSAENRATIAIELRSIAEEIQRFSDAKDFRGAPLFSTGDALAIPVSDGISLAPVDTRARVFGTVPTSAGPRDVVTILNQAAAAIVEPDDTLRAAATTSSIAALAAAGTHVAAARSEQGLRAERLDTIRERLMDAGIKLTEERSSLESADVVDAIARIQSKDVSLKAAQAVFAQLNRSGLFDLLR